MLRTCAVLIAALLLPAAVADARAVDVPRTARTELPKVAKRTPLPVLLPDRIDLDISQSQRVYATGFGTRREWAITLAGARRCGANACFLGSFSARRTRRLGARPNATLVQGIRAHFKPLSCGGSCSPPAIAWVLSGVRYEIQAKTIAGTKAEFVALANSALAAGGRD